MRKHRAIVLALFLTSAAAGRAIAQEPAQEPAQRFGGAFSGLDARRQHYIVDWVARFAKTTGQTVQPEPFYDEVLAQSTKTTFDAITHALLTTKLTDSSGKSLGDALALVERIETVRGDVPGASGDRQFRMYVRLIPGALDTLRRSKEFKRGKDNSVYHKGYPISFRQQGGEPSVQVSSALDGRRADIDVDYRASSFPSALFNGHLTSANSDVRAGPNYDRHQNRWTGLGNWWQGFFGVSQSKASDVAVSGPNRPVIPVTPRLGKKDIHVMVNDFLTAWLVEGNVVQAMGYVSERSYACLAQESENPSDFDRGLAPIQLMINMKAAHDALATHESLQQLITGMRLPMPGLRVVKQPHAAQFVIYQVPDDIAAKFDCERQLTLGDVPVKRNYGNWYGATFSVAGNRDSRVALLWKRENGYWKVTSWKVGTDDANTPAPDAVVGPAIAHIRADTSLVTAARGFLESWLVRKEYDTAFGYFSPKAYACYDLERSSEAPAATSLDDAGRKLRAALEVAGTRLGNTQKLDAVISGAEPLHSAVRVMDHAFAGVFSLTSLPNALADAAECTDRTGDITAPDAVKLEYGKGFGMTMRFKTQSGDAPVFRLLWRRENGAWRITAYTVELP